MKLATACVVVVLGGLGVAHADGPTARFGLTFAMADRVAPSDVHQIGPLVALGDRVGPFVGEVEWAYLSLFDPEASPTGVHRLGVTLRADLWRNVRMAACTNFACTHASSLYAEAGAGERYGTWMMPNLAPGSGPRPEAHIGLGYETDNQAYPNRYGWQFGVRLTFARADEYMFSCRSTGGSCVNGATTVGGGVAEAVLIEWMYLLGR
jgi:hypothetical protein